MLRCKTSGERINLSGIDSIFSSLRNYFKICNNRGNRDCGERPNQGFWMGNDTALLKQPLGRVQSKSDRFLLFIGLLSFMGGSFVYFSTRSPLYGFIPDGRIWFASSLPSAIQQFSGQIPSFAHALSFSIFLGMVIGPSFRQRVIGCAVWAGIGSLCEALQGTAERNQNLTFTKFPLHIPILPGVFDWFDIIATLGGAGSAACLFALCKVRWFANKENCNG